MISHDEAPLRYISLFSGIEAASVAWQPLGWEPVAFSEIAPFPSAVLAHHFPDVPALGDMTQVDWSTYRDRADLVCGGSPCQSFSVAGLRKGLADPRGNLALEYLRAVDGIRPRWVVWENVPGVLSSGGGRDFAAFLGGLGQLGYGFAYRVLDAQYVRVESHPRAVPQRRRRVWVVGHLGDWRPAAAVLLERESLLGHPAPRREAGKVAPTIPSRSTGGGSLGTDFDCDGGLIHQEVASTLTVAMAKNGGLQAGNDSRPHNLVAHTLRGEGFDASEDGTGRGIPLVIAHGQANAEIGSDASPTLTLLHEAPIVFSCKDYGNDCGEVAPTLRSMGHDGSHANGGGQVAVAFAENQRGEVRTSDVMMSLSCAGGKPGSGYPAVAQGYSVRRLTPRECERLMGLPDDWTDVPWRGKEHAPDGPRYKAIGNSWAVNCAEWIGRRIQAIEETA